MEERKEGREEERGEKGEKKGRIKRKEKGKKMFNSDEEKSLKIKVLLRHLKDCHTRKKSYSA